MFSPADGGGWTSVPLTDETIKGTMPSGQARPGLGRRMGEDGAVKSQTEVTGRGAGRIT